MSTYPIAVDSVALEHKGGTKAYYVTRISTNDGRHLLVNRWGKVGVFGEVQVFKFTDRKTVEKEFEKKIRAKRTGGYELKANGSGLPNHGAATFVASDAQELVKKLTVPLFDKLGKDAISFLDPAIDTSRMREAEPPQLDEEGRKINRNTARKADLSDAIAAEKEAERKQVEQTYASNPLFGRF
ncbi:WGR domain-containing protein [Ancylobacter rudongensis]|uniref:WGR domain-containing protein n=1 Tax=Ancylobacter rudongensis TaxID=177413 RepID=A0A1G4USH0_9HYPH|nr:WGR domain-containing protein [Ancylobacter rudongensis]SCW95729.1 WGR domain-containing protein [Ancylobacter rudongensis]